jgi:ABC-type antimicrobial peptide transport system permease subunit
MAVLSTGLRQLALPDAMFLQLAAVPIWQSPFGAQTYMLPAVIVLSVTGALLLLIVSTNLSGLVLARGLSRRGEIALRLALGASRGRILRLLLVENIVLAAPAAIAALALVPVVLPLFLSAVSASAPVRLFFNLSVDWLVIAFSAAAAVASASAFGLVPALRSAWVDLAVMKDDLLARGAVKGRVRMGPSSHRWPCR